MNNNEVESKQLIPLSIFAFDIEFNVEKHLQNQILC